MAIYCVRCGAPNEGSATTCSACGARLVSLGTLGEAAHAIDKTVKKPIGSILLLIVCVIYLLNPFFGFDILPDNLPIVGNLDEVGATYLMLTAMSGLGWVSLSRRKRLPSSHGQTLSEERPPHDMR